MTEITLSAAIKAALIATQQNAALAERTAERLASGNRVNGPVDDAPAFFLAQQLSDRAGDLLSVKDRIGQAAGTIGASLAGLDAVAAVAGQLKGIAAAARGGSAETRAAAAVQFDQLRGQLSAIADDAGFGGVNLIGASPDDLTIRLDETGSSTLTIQGRASDAAALGIGTAAADFGGFATDADIDAAIGALDDAVATVRTTAAGFGADAGVLNTRAAFTDDLVNRLEAGAAGLVRADLNEEAARLLSLRLSGELGAVGLAIANDTQQAVLQLFEV